MIPSKERVCINVPLLLPARRKAERVRMMPKTSCDRMVVILPWLPSGRCSVNREPQAVTICCSLVPANCPRMACVTAAGGWMVREYMNIEDVVAMLGCLPGRAPGLQELRLYTNGAVEDLNLFRDKRGVRSEMWWLTFGGDDLDIKIRGLRSAPRLRSDWPARRKLSSRYHHFS